jgi:non-specific serine/threonine protein kinase
VERLTEALALSAGDAAALVAAGSRRRGPTPHGTALPVALTSFVGRERELASARELVRVSRLVTFTGVGGSGKTRLALELTAELSTQFRGGIALVELAPLADPAFIAQVTAQAIGLVGDTRTDTAAALVRALTHAEMLLVLDNCEHLIDHCASLAERLLRGCAGLRILATSREPLGIPGEVTFSVPPLRTPSMDGPAPTDEVGDCEAVQLFADRAAAARPGFVLDDAHIRVVARICSRLDGLPLAIELAAARARSMSLDDLDQRLDHRFSLLAGGGRTTPARHQTLRATIDWSYELLTEDEQILFRRLAVFAGGWTLVDAETVCADHRVPQDAIVDVHARVADKSLIVANPLAPGASRHRLLETIRQYAAERLAEAGEVDLMQRRHFGHFLAVAERYYHDRMAGGDDSALLTLAAHSDNFRAALAWGAAADPEGSLRLASALDEFWRMVNATEGWNWLQRLLRDAPEGNPHRLRALLTAGPLAAQVAAYAEGTHLLRPVVATARQSGDRLTEAWARLWLGRLAVLGEDLATAEEHLEAALALHVELGLPLGRVRSLAVLGLLQVAMLQRRAEGEENLQAAADLARGIGDSWGEGFAHMILTISAADAGDVERTLRHCRTALHIPSLGSLCGVALHQLGRVIVEEDPAQAMRLMGAAAGYLERTGTVLPPFLQRRADPARQRAEDLLGVQAAGQEFEDGQRMSIEEVITFVDSEPVMDSWRNPGGLTPRQLQVAALVGGHRTNREIGRILGVSVRTAESHVDHILAKLDLSNRLALTAWAQENGLVADEKHPSSHPSCSD